MNITKYQVQCRHFSGYKPCSKSSVCDSLCSFKDIPSVRIALIHLGAIGAVVRSTSLLQPLKAKYPSSHITWITSKPSNELLENHHLLDMVLTTSTEDILKLANFTYDVVICVDKSLVATGIAKTLKAKDYFGFTSDARGGIVPATPAAFELWQLGLDNHKKFFINKKPETELMQQAFELTYTRSEYNLPLSESEKKLAARRRNSWSMDEGEIFVGINTGCSNAIPYKKLPYDAYVDLILYIQSQRSLVPVLLGGPEDRERNERLHIQTGALLSPSSGGLRDGLVSVAACDLVISGDSLGMHMAISQKKWVIAWFGPTCAHEIDLYERGEKILTQASCSPCWKRHCNKPTMCYDLVSLDQMKQAILRGVHNVLNLRTDADINL